MYCDVTNNQNMIYIQFADIPPVEVRTILKKNKDIRCRITEIKSEVENINDQLATIESGKNELVEELTKQELKRQIVLPPNDEIQKELSQSILTNLKSFGDIKEELKKEMETKQKPKEVKKDFGIGE